MSKHINDHVTFEDRDRDLETLSLRERREAFAIAATAKALDEHQAQMKTLTNAYAEMALATAELVRKAATARFAPAVPKAPPPVSTHLRRFTRAIADKVVATTELLDGEQRGRVAALVPAFISATVRNDPGVVALVMRWMDQPPAEIARDLIARLDDFERNFSS